MLSSLHKRHLSDSQISTLNDKYRSLEVRERIKELYRDFNLSEIMLTSSFAATSALLLKLFSDINRKQPVYFIDTGYHFKETLGYQKKLTELYELEVRSISALKEEHDFTTADETWKKNPDFCCYVNKVKPLEIIKARYSVWVSGLMEWQSEHRSSLDIFEQRGDILKFYPLLDLSKAQRDEFMEKENLPLHPLVPKGYDSIGCTHCTVAGEDRNGRWNTNAKTECGLHL